MSSKQNQILASVIALAAVLAAPAFAADAGMKVVKDAKTGALRAPNAEEFKAMQAQEENSLVAKKKASKGLLTETESPKAVQMRNGGVKLELTEDTLVHSIAVKKPDGSIEMQCVTGKDAANKVLNGQAPSHNHNHKEQHNDVK